MERETREQAISYAQALKEFMPGMEHSELAVIGPAVGLPGDPAPGGVGTP